jgi:PIN domain nuclease of toxin-antitoxin system
LQRLKRCGEHGLPSALPALGVPSPRFVHPVPRPRPHGWAVCGNRPKLPGISSSRRAHLTGGRLNIREAAARHAYLDLVAHIPEKLSRAVRRELDNPKNEIHLSPVAIWEAHHMERRKKLRLKKDFTGWLDQVFLQTPVREAPFNFAVAAAASRIQLAQADLGDVFWPPRPSSLTSL